MKKIIALIAFLAAITLAQVLTLNKGGHWNIAVMDNITGNPSVYGMRSFFDAVPSTSPTEASQSIWYGRAIFDAESQNASIYFWSTQDQRQSGDTSLSVCQLVNFNKNTSPTTLTCATTHSSGVSVSVQYDKTDLLLVSATLYLDLKLMNASLTDFRDTLNAADRTLIHVKQVEGETLKSALVAGAYLLKGSTSGKIVEQTQVLPIGSYVVTGQNTNTNASHWLRGDGAWTTIPVSSTDSASIKSLIHDSNLVQLPNYLLKVNFIDSVHHYVLTPTGTVQGVGQGNSVVFLDMLLGTGISKTQSLTVHNGINAFTGGTFPASMATQGINMGYDNNAEVGWIQCVREDTAHVRACWINPLGGNLVLSKSGYTVSVPGLLTQGGDSVATKIYARSVAGTVSPDSIRTAIVNTGEVKFFPSGLSSDTGILYLDGTAQHLQLFTHSIYHEIPFFTDLDSLFTSFRVCSSCSNPSDGTVAGWEPGDGGAIGRQWDKTYGDTLATKEYDDGAVYSIPSGSTNTDMDTIPNLVSVKTIRLDASTGARTLALSVAGAYPAGRELTVKIYNYTSATLELDGAPGHDIISTAANGTYTLPRALGVVAKIYSVTMIWDGTDWNITGTGVE